MKPAGRGTGVIRSAKPRSWRPGLRGEGASRSDKRTQISLVTPSESGQSVGKDQVCIGAGYPRKAFRQINRFVQERLEKHLRRRSQRPFRPTAGLTWYAQLQKLGLQSL